MDLKNTAPSNLIPDHLMRKIALTLLALGAIAAPIMTAINTFNGLDWHFPTFTAICIVITWLFRKKIPTPWLVNIARLLAISVGMNAISIHHEVVAALVSLQMPLLLLTLNWSRIWALIGIFGVVLGFVAIPYAFPAIEQAPLSTILISIIFPSFFSQVIPMLIKDHLAQLQQKNASFDGIEEALNTAKIGFEVIDPATGNFTYASKQASQYSGRTQQQVIGTPLHEIDTTYRPEIFAELIDDLTVEGSRIIETEHQLPNGGTEPLEVSLALVKDNEGNPYRLFALTRSIRERKAEQEALEQSAMAAQAQVNNLATYFEALDYGQIGFEITDANNDGKFLYVNTSAAAHSGHSPLKMLDLSVPDIDPNVSVEKYNAIIKQLHASKERTMVIETERLTPDGATSIPLRISLYLETDQNDQPSRLFAFTQNISEQVEARELIAKEKDILEKEVEKRTGDIQKLLQVKTEFMANMSHEIRTPMHTIISMSKSLTDQLTDSDHHREATVVHRTAKSLLNILDDILDSSKLESGKLLLDPRNIQFENLLNDILEEKRSLAKRKHLYLELHNELKNDLWVHVDDNRIRQILKNIIGNAIKFTETGGVSLTVRSHHLRDDQQGLVKIELEVKDTGLGIDEETLKRLFNRFEQADKKTSRIYGGTGLGLAIARDLAQMMDGDISVKSTPRVGTTFSITLTVPVGNKQIVTQSSDMPLKGHVLIVDDVDVNRMIATQIVKQLGMTTEEAETGYEALERVRETHFDAILMDIQMPHIDGLDTTKLIHEYESSHEQKRTPIIAVTAHAMAEDREAAIEVGMNDYLTKPFDKADLRDALLRNGIRPLDNALTASTQTDKDNDAGHVTAESDLISKDEVAIWDKDELAQRLGDDPQMVCMLMQRFYEDLAIMMADLHIAVSFKEHADVAKAAHSIKGAARSVSAHALGNKALELELIAKDHVTSLYQPTTNDIEREIERLKESSDCLEESA